MTRQCNLHCPHCYLDATSRLDEAELSSTEAVGVIDQIAELSPGAMVVFSGGEPLLRPDLPRLVNHASTRGLMSVLGTNGTLLDELAIRELLACGLAGTGISLDSATPDYHDAFRGAKGAWQKALAAMEACQRAGVPFQVQMSLTRGNLPQLEAMVELSSRLGAVAFNLFFLVCTGRGERLSDITPQEYDQALLALAQLQGWFPEIRLRARCAPQFTRLLAERNTSEAALPMGCLAGSSYLRLTPEGEVTPCPYLPLVVGDLRWQNLADLWKSSRVLIELRRDEWRGGAVLVLSQPAAGDAGPEPMPRAAITWERTLGAPTSPRRGSARCP
ncbi:MAG: radical SAM protein [Chloroflexi bacterium]|nr:radical SAM protein [Chloroflexota bacterium]